MSEGLQIGLCVAVIAVYLVLTAWWLHQNWSEFEQQRDELARATDELGRILGEALRPPLERVLRDLARMTRSRDD